MNDLLVLLVILALQGLWTLLTLYIAERVKQAARGAVDESVGRALNEQRHDFERRLEELRLERDRLAQDFGLFASKRNEVYVEVYSHFTKTVDLYHSVVGFSEGYAFDSFEREQVESYLLIEVDLPADRQTRLLDLWDRDRGEAVRALNQLQHETRRRKAESTFREAKNVAVLNELYFSVDVDTALHALAHAIAAVVVRVWRPDERTGGQDAWEAQQVAEARRNDLKQIMQTELRRGFAPLPVDTNKPTE